MKSDVTSDRTSTEKRVLVIERCMNGVHASGNENGMPHKHDNNLLTALKQGSNPTHMKSNEFLTSWVEWCATVAHQKLDIPQLPAITIGSPWPHRYIINGNGWWPLFGGEQRRKRKHGASTSAFCASSVGRRPCASASSTPFSKRRKIHNSSHFSSPFSNKNYLAVEWSSDSNELQIAKPPRTTTSALPQENFAAVTSRVLLVRRLKAKQGFVKGDAASRFRKSIVLKAAQVPAGDGLGDPSNASVAVDSPGDVLIKRPWKDGTTEPCEGTFKELQDYRMGRQEEMKWTATAGADKLRLARDFLTNQMYQGSFYLPISQPQSPAESQSWEK